MTFSQSVSIVKILLDTHIAIWALGLTQRLPATTQTLLVAPGNEIHVSMVSLWEIAIKYSRKGRRDTPPYSAEDSKRAFVDAGFRMLDIREEHIFEVGRLPHLHRDPFDRLLVAQALAEPMRLLTHDPQVAAYNSNFIHF